MSENNIHQAEIVQELLFSLDREPTKMQLEEGIAEVKTKKFLMLQGKGNWNYAG
jgi:hypothetical protein